MSNSRKSRECTRCHEIIQAVGFWSKKCTVCLACRAKITAEKKHRHYLKHIDQIKAKDRKYNQENSEKNVARVAAWRKKNPDRMAEQRKKHREKHKAKRKADNIKWWANHPDYHKGWRDKNPTVISAYRHSRRARINGTTSGAVNWDEVENRTSGKCGICGKTIPAGKTYPHPLSPSWDHIVPLSKGGSHTEGNVQLTHLRCNVAKKNNIPASGVQPWLL